MLRVSQVGRRARYRFLKGILVERVGADDYTPDHTAIIADGWRGEVWGHGRQQPSAALPLKPFVRLEPHGAWNCPLERLLKVVATLPPSMGAICRAEFGGG